MSASFVPGEAAERTQSAALPDATGPLRSRNWGRCLTGLGVVTFASGGLLAAMFVSLGLGRSAAPWGPINDALGAVSNVVLAAAIPMLSRRAVRRRWERMLVCGTAAVSVVAAVSAALLVAGILAFEPSTVISASPAAYALLIPGVVGGGIAWLGWPAWYLLLGRYVAASAPAAESPAISESAK